jgi:hypothetical protein
MKYLTTFAFVASLAGIAGMAACSSGSSDAPTAAGGSGNTSAGGAATAGAATAGAATAGAATGGAATGGAARGGAATGGAATGGASGAGTAGSAGASGAGAGGASAGSGGASGGAGGASAGSGGASGSGGGSSAVVTTCGAQVYTPTATPNAVCVTKVVPAAKLVSDFEAAGVAPGWGVYPTVDAMTGFVPTTATPSTTAGGANGTTKSLSFVVTALAQGIKIQVGFGTQCQDVRTFTGLSFWAKGTIDAVATTPYQVNANTLVLELGSENTAQGGCMAGTMTCSTAPNDQRVTITTDWKEYRIPFNCFGNAMGFDGYYTNILFHAFGTNSNFAIDQVGYY